MKYDGMVSRIARNAQINPTKIARKASNFLSASVKGVLLLDSSCKELTYNNVSRLFVNQE